MLTLKNRDNEFKAVRVLRENHLFAEGLIPMIEVIREDFHFDKLIDPVTGDYVKTAKPYKSGKRKGQMRMCKVDDPSTKREVTLSNIEAAFPGMRVLVDFFRCDIQKYKEADLAKCKLVLSMSNDREAYENRVKQVASYPNLVPVVSVVDGLDNLDPGQLANFIKELKRMRGKEPVAVRISDYEGYGKILASVLESSDYLIYDINETPFASRAEEFGEISSFGIKAQKVLLCSPRKRNDGNRVYEDGCFVDNGHIEDYASYGFVGVGDYAGLRDSLPARQGAGASGRALAFLYDGENNKFIAYVNPDVSRGQSGYDDVVKKILADRDKLERTPGECIVLSDVAERAEKEEYGNWQTWIERTVVRYVQQLYFAHGDSYDF